MAELIDVENALISAVEAIEINASPAFKTVKGFNAARDRAVEEAIRREVKPAAYVTYDGRYSDIQDNFFHGHLMYSVYVAADGLRGGDEARIGAFGVIGAFDLMSEVTQAIVSAQILPTYLVTFRYEYIAAADDTFMLMRQAYIILGPGVPKP